MTMLETKETKVVDNLRVGKPDIEPSAPSHLPGIHQGNKKGNLKRNAGLKPTGPLTASGSARRSTGINPKHREPIDPRMPRLSPA
jgi:hypothetical protein